MRWKYRNNQVWATWVRSIGTTRYGLHEVEVQDQQGMAYSTSGWSTGTTRNGQHEAEIQEQQGTRNGRLQEQQGLDFRYMRRRNRNNKGWRTWSREWKQPGVNCMKWKQRNHSVLIQEKDVYGIDDWDERNETTRNCVTVKEVQGTRNMKYKFRKSDMQKTWNKSAGTTRYSKQEVEVRRWK